MRHILVVGGGLGGLTVATLLARAGHRVTLFERSAHLGGRGQSVTESGFTRNLGPHALYARGPAAALLPVLGVPFSGSIAQPRAVGRWQGGLVSLPGGVGGILTGSVLRGWERLDALRLLAGLGRVDPAATTAQWLAGVSPIVAAWARALGRVATYAHPVDALPARVTAKQIQLAVGGVRYLDGGWQTLVDGLADAARAAGVTLSAGEDALEASATEVRTATRTVTGDAVVLAVPAPAAEKLGARLPARVPSRQAFLDLALRAPDRTWPGLLLDLDGPGYVSDHGAVARLAPDGATIVHAAAYLAPDEATDRAAVEALVDLAMPGWRDQLVNARWTPQMTVQHALPVVGAARVGLQDDGGRWHVGDHVDSDYLLFDAVMDSASRVARAVSQTLQGGVRPSARSLHAA